MRPFGSYLNVLNENGAVKAPFSFCSFTAARRSAADRVTDQSSPSPATNASRLLWPSVLDEPVPLFAVPAGSGTATTSPEVLVDPLLVS